MFFLQSEKKIQIKMDLQSTLIVTQPFYSLGLGPAQDKVYIYTSENLNNGDDDNDVLSTQGKCS